jgi:GntR family transcriptional regulator / MocR family aminotransferase
MGKEHGHHYACLGERDLASHVDGSVPASCPGKKGQEMQKRLGHESAAREIGLDIDRTLDRPMYLQICQRFKTAIEQGHLHAGNRVPAVRALATELNISRGTVELAYRILTDEGYFQVRGAAGTVVAPSLPVLAASKPQAALPGHSPGGIIDHDGRASKPLQPDLPALDAFPRKVWNRLVGHRLRGSDPARLAYPDPAGYGRLR